MTIDLDAIRARAAAATPGPWQADDTEIYGETITTWVAETLLLDDRAQGKANATFIAAARQDIPDLLAKVTELQAELDYERRMRFTQDEKAAGQVEDLRTEIDEKDCEIGSLRQDLDSWIKQGLENTR